MISNIVKGGYTFIWFCKPWKNFIFQCHTLTHNIDLRRSPLMLKLFCFCCVGDHKEISVQNPEHYIFELFATFQIFYVLVNVILTNSYHLTPDLVIVLNMDWELVRNIKWWSKRHKTLFGLNLYFLLWQFKFCNWALLKFFIIILSIFQVVLQRDNLYIFLFFLCLCGFYLK